MKKLFLSIVIFIGILCLGSIIATSNFNNDLNFEFNGVNYSLNLEDLASENDINLEDYPYYFIGDVSEKDSSQLALFLSKGRISLEKKETDETNTITYYYVRGGEETLEFVVEADGSMQEVQMVDLKTSKVVIAERGFVVSNEDIYCEENSLLVFGKNYGYDEKQEEVEEMIDEKLQESVYSDVEEQEDETILNYLETEENEDVVKRIEFPYKGKIYTVDLKESELGVDLGEYEYYFVYEINNSQLGLYYSKERLGVGYYNSKYINYLKAGMIQVKIGTNGTLSTSIVENNNRIDLYGYEYVAANQNIYYEDKLVFGKNCGYEYDETNEAGDECDEIVKTKNKINVYEKAAVNHDILATIPAGGAIKRVKKAVNEVNGHVWDKVILSNGKEGYAFSDELEIETEAKEISFEYKEETYMIYLSPTSLGVDLKDYEYYFVYEINNSQLGLYYSKERLGVGYYNSKYINYLKAGMIQVKIGTNGTLSTSIVENNNRIDLYGYEYVAANQNIYYEDKLVFGKNCGYEYDETNETGDECDEMVRIKNKINVYEKAAVNYDILATITEGNAVRRIKKAVNEVNGRVWDKVLLSNGKVGYIFSDIVELEGEIKEAVFKYEGHTYAAYLSPTSLGVDLKDYEYYFVRKVNESQLELYYTNERIYANYYNSSRGYYRTHLNKDAIKVIIRTSGTLTTSIVSDFVNIDMYSSEYVAANQNIYYENKLVFGKNCGYEYNEKQGEECDEIVKPKNKINVYEKAAVNYDIKATISMENVVKRVKKAVNEVNGHVWDKVILSNGKVGYVFADELELVTNENDIKTVNFQYKDDVYTIYLSSTVLGVNLEEYGYYFVRKISDSQLELYYTNERIYANYYNSSRGYYRIHLNKNAIKVIIRTSGTLTTSIVPDFVNIDMYSSEYVAANQDIYYGDRLIFSICILDEPKKVFYKKDLTWDGISLSESNYETIRKGEELYNSMSSLEASKLSSDLIGWWTMAWSGAMAAKDTYEDASSALLYFLTKGEYGKTDNVYTYEEGIFSSEHTMREISIKNILSDSFDMREKFHETVNSVVSVAENIGINEENPIVFSNIFENSGTVTKDSSINWYLAMNNYRIRTENSFTRIGGQFYTLKLKYGILDYYDWENRDNQYNEDFSNILNVTATHMYDLHRAGRARNYTNYVEINCLIEWRQGERVGTGVKISDFKGED